MRNSLVFMVMVLLISGCGSVAVVKHTKKAEQAMDQESYERALEEYNSALMHRPGFADLYYNRGVVKLRLDDPFGAVRDFSAAIHIEPNHIDALFNRGSALSDLKDYAGALADLNRVIALSGGNTEAWNNRGLVKLRQDNYSGAMGDLNVALDLDPDNAFAHYNKGLVYLATERYSSALESLESATSIDTAFGEGWVVKGLAYVLTGDVQSGMSMIEKGRSLECDPEMYHLYRGLVLMEIEDYESALTEIDRAVEINPEETHTFFARGQARFHTDDYDGAIADLDLFLDDRPNNALGFAVRGSAHAQKGNVYEALRDFNRALQIDSTYHEMYFHRGKTKYGFGDSEGALEDCNIYLEMAEDDIMADAYILRGLIYFDRGEVIASRQNFAAAMTVDSLRPEPWMFNAFFRIMDDDEPIDAALKDLDKAISLAPDYALVYQVKGELLIEFDRFEEALECFNLSIKYDPDDRDSRMYRAALLFEEMEDYEAALADFAILMEFYPDDTEVLEFYAEVLEEMDNLSGAEEVYTQLISLEEDLDYFVYRGLIRIDLDNKAGACEDFKRAEQLGSWYAKELIRKNCQGVGH